MTEAEKDLPKTSGSKFRTFQNGLRLVLILLVIWVSYWTAKTVKRIVAGPQNTAPVQEPDSPSPPSFDALNDSAEPGYWAFEQQDWAIAQSNISPEDFQQHLLNRLTAETETESSLAGQELLNHFQRFGTPSQLGENGQLYRLGSSGGPFALTRGSGSAERLVTTGFVMPEQNGKWQLIEMLPASNATQPTNLSEKSLLPLPPDSRRLMSRWSNSGELVLDWVHVPLSGTEMVRQWLQSGLKLRKTAGILGAESSYLYEQNGEVIIVNTFPSTEGGADLLISKSTDVHLSSDTGTTDRKP